MKFSVAIAYATLALAAPATAAELQRLEGDKFTVMMPGKADVDANTVDIPAGKVETQAWTMMTDEGVIYSISSAEYPEKVVAANPVEKFLDEGMNALTNQLKGTVKSTLPIRVDGGNPGREFVVASDNGEVKARAFRIGNRLYTMLVLYNPAIGAPQRDAFLTSFRLKK